MTNQRDRQFDRSIGALPSVVLPVIEYRAVGPPGCGKTTWISTQAQNAVEKYGPDSVMLASLTRAAAAELIGRGLNVNPDRIGTLHAHAFRALDRPKLAQDAEHVAAWNAHVSKKGKIRWGLSKTITDEDMGRSSYGEGLIGDTLQEKAEMWRHQCVPFDRWPDDRTKEWFRMWQEFKEMSYAMDFTDLIVKATEDIDCAPGNPRFIFIDEAQDLSLLELKLVRKWAQHCEKFIMVGDPDQCLFEWRGSSPLNFENPKVPEENYKYLTQSFRVPSEVRSVAMDWLRHVADRRVVEYKPRTDNGIPVNGFCKRSPLSYKETDELLFHAKRYTDDGKSVMFLASASYMLRPLVKKMRERGLPFHNPYNRKRSDWNPLSAVSGAGDVSMAERIRAFAYGGWLSDASELKKWLLTLKLDHFRAGKWVDTDFVMKLRGKPDLNAIFSEEALRQCVSTDYDWLVEGMKAQYKKKTSTAYAIRVARKFGERALNEVPKLIVGTIHSVKGGEADVVYLFPEISRAADEEWLYGNRDGIYRAFYVAMTRAREGLVLCNVSEGGRCIQWPPRNRQRTRIVESSAQRAGERRKAAARLTSRVRAALPERGEPDVA